MACTLLKTGASGLNAESDKGWVKRKFVGTTYLKSDDPVFVIGGGNAYEPDVSSQYLHLAREDLL